MSLPSSPNADLSPSREKFIGLIKRVSKREKKRLDESENITVSLATLYDGVASALGYKNWSLFHRDIARMSDMKFAEIEQQLLEFPEVRDFLNYLAVDQEKAREEMREYVTTRFTPLVNFAFYDSESENGYAWPDVDLYQELEEEFDGRFPSSLIEEVAREMEVDEGPWGEENYGG